MCIRDRYLTGLLTPDGITFFASENNFCDFANIRDLYAGIIILGEFLITRLLHTLL